VGGVSYLSPFWFLSAVFLDSAASPNGEAGRRGQRPRRLNDFFENPDSG
jgi:hypothetical protein